MTAVRAATRRAHRLLPKSVTDELPGGTNDNRLAPADSTELMKARTAWREYRDRLIELQEAIEQPDANTAELRDEMKELKLAEEQAYRAVLQARVPALTRRLSLCRSHMALVESELQRVRRQLAHA